MIDLRSKMGQRVDAVSRIKRATYDLVATGRMAHRIRPIIQKVFNLTKSKKTSVKITSMTREAWPVEQLMQDLSTMRLRIEISVFKMVFKETIANSGHLIKRSL